ncbi:2'-5' RNA ligase family protein [Gordonia polyisoprenivorans]|uniref:2'-5' RNA ligase family protein n=1 Tax=Gordonia polyisoprenivorans TaxID=84595 RepID=UPI001AD67516|nr:2'-5' RNA ligase family protein [Gordonia polyisoprenivorans]QTI67453.1 2'-5' RNA ligase family protein [Gordonia polyisoprenivorans]
MAHSVEFLVDDASDQQIRTQWAALADAGLPSQAGIASSTNRPHITALAAAHIAPGIDTALATVGMRLPFTVALGGVVVFGYGRKRVVARLVVPTSELLSTHAAAVRLGAPFATDHKGRAGVFDHCVPGSWTPHVTLARRVPLEQLPALFHALEPYDPVIGEAPMTVVGLRRWDSDTRTARVIGGRAC